MCKGIKKETFPNHPITKCQNCGYPNTGLVLQIDNEVSQIGYRCHNCMDEKILVELN